MESVVERGFQQEKNLSRRDFLKLTALFGVAVAGGGSLLRRADEINAASDTEIRGPFPKGSKDLYHAWNELKRSYTYKEDKGSETWQIESKEGDCEDFVLRLYYRELPNRKRYSTQLAKVMYDDTLEVFNGRSRYESSGGHMVMFFVNEQKQLFIVDNGGWGGINGPYKLEGGFQSIKEMAQIVTKEQNKVKKYPFNTIAKRKVKKVEVKSLPRELPKGGVEELRKERGWSLAYSSE